MADLRDNLLDDLALERGYVTRTQLEICRKESVSDKTKPIGQVFLEKGLISPQQLSELLQLRSERLKRQLGEPAAAHGLFGQIALSKGYLQPLQLNEVIKEQTRKAVGNGRIPLGKILAEKGYLAKEQILEILQTQGKRILKCDGCQTKYTVDGSWEEHRRIRCHKCGKILAIPKEVASITHAPPLSPAASPAPDTRWLREHGLKPTTGLARLGQYEILEEIARGGMGVVFKARDPRLNRIVAMKVLKEGEDADETMIKRFYREAQAAARLRHENIVPIHDVGMEGGLHFFTMDFIEGEPLDLLMAKKKIATGDALHVLEEISRAVHFAHTQGVIHRDIKPANVMVTPRGRGLIMDFGLAKTLDTATLLTKSGSAIGTPFYMSPEQVRGNPQEINEQSDVYSLGVMLYEIITGQLPFVGATTLDIYQKIATDEPPRPRAVLPTVHPDLETICLKAMEKEKHHRYPTAEEFAEDLRRFRSGEFILARPPSLVAKGVRRIRKHKLASVLIAILLLLGVTFPIVLVTRSRFNERKIQLEKKIADWLIAAENHLGQEEPDRAEQLLNHVRRIKPDHPDAITIQSRVQTVRHRLTSLEEARRAIEKGEWTVAKNSLDEAEKYGAPRDRTEALQRRTFGRLTVRIEGSPATLCLWEINPETAALSPQPVCSQEAPLAAYELLPGTYRVEIQDPEGRRIQFPLRLHRDPQGFWIDHTTVFDFDFPKDMVLIPEGNVTSQIGSTRTIIHLPGFLMDRLEVTGKKYQAFLASLSHEEREIYCPPGWPRDGSYLEGWKERPVSGLDWECARRYALWIGKRLPTNYEWKKTNGEIDEWAFMWAGDTNLYGLGQTIRGMAEWTAGVQEIIRPGPPPRLPAPDSLPQTLDPGSIGFRCAQTFLLRSTREDASLLADLTQQADPGIRKAALEALAALDWNTARPRMITALNDEDVFVCATAVRHLKSHGEEMDRFLKLPFTPGTIQCAELMAMEQIPSGINFLKQGVTTDDPSVKEAAALSLIRIGSLFEGFIRLYETQAAYERIQNSAAQFRIKAFLERSKLIPLALHKTMLRHKDPLVRKYGLERTGQLQDREEKEQILKLTNDWKNPDVKDAAHKVYDQLFGRKSGILLQTARSLLAQGRLNEAWDAAHEAVIVNPSAKTFYFRGIIHERQNRLPEALEDWSQALKFQERYAPAYGSRGLAYLRQEKLREAIDDLRRYLETEDHTPRPWSPPEVNREAIQKALHEAESKLK